MSSARQHTSETEIVINRYPFYSPRFWNGMRLGDYWRLLSRNRFRVHTQRIPMSFLVGSCAAVNSVTAFTQRLFFGKQIDETTVLPPVFIIGHWRTGTTLLHELLSLDDQFAYPTTFQCFVPHNFLVTGWFLRPLLKLLVPSRRPMDNMSAGLQRPQEDEFALCALGAPTPYQQIAFCCQDPVHVDLLNTDDARPEDIAKLQQALSYFLKTLTRHNDKPLLLKSPPHTGRIKALSKWFPGAKFIHITRHPHNVFPSTVHLWKTLYEVQGFQLPRFPEKQLHEYVHRCFETMYEGYFSQQEQLCKENLIEVSFEALLSNPADQLASIYNHLGFDNVESAQQKALQYLARRGNYQRNQTCLDESTRKEIDLRWGKYIDRYGYQLQPS